MTAPFPSRIVPPAKITEYLMNPNHEEGGPKEAFFSRFGFSAGDVAEMTASLAAHPDLHPIETTSQDRYGTTHTVRCSMPTPDSRNPCVKTVWMVRDGEMFARFVTAYPG